MRSSTELSRRLLGLCVAAGLVVAVAPPAIHTVVSQQELSARAFAHAFSIANALSRLAARQPRLWRYNVGKVAKAAGQHPAGLELGELRIVDCAGRELFDGAQLGIQRPGSIGPVARRAIMPYGRAVGFVEVAVDATRSRMQWLAVLLASTLLGIALASGLYLLPARRIAQQEDEERRRRLAERVIEIEERERQRIARDLHDGVGQHLSAARAAIELGKTASALASTDDALSELRHAVFSLRPRELDESGAAAAIEAAVRRFEDRVGIAAAFRQAGAELRDSRKGAALLRIAQEALSNVAKHASASEVGVELTVADGRVTLTVRDDGAGFDVAAATSGTGLVGIKERARLLGGDARVRSSDSGTELTAWLPVAEVLPVVDVRVPEQ